MAKYWYLRDERMREYLATAILLAACFLPADAAPTEHRRDDSQKDKPATTLTLTSSDARTYEGAGVIPEPSTLGIIGAGGLLGLLKRKKRRQ